MSAASLWLIAAVLAQGVLVFIITVLLYRARIPLIVRGKVRIADIALDRDNWPEASRQVANAFSNQFEVPVLFYVAALLSLYFGATFLDALLAWAFVISRYVHAYIHVTNNHVIRRFFAFAVGTVIVCVFWVVLIVRLILAAASGGSA
jgi:hypothetical protein